MKKRLFSAITAAAMTASAGLVYFPAGVFELTAKAADPITGETADGFTYEITDEAVTITSSASIISSSVKERSITATDSR